MPVPFLISKVNEPPQKQVKKKCPETNSPEAGTRFEAFFCLVPTPRRGGRLKLAPLISIEVSVMHPQRNRSESARQKLRVKYRNQIRLPLPRGFATA